MNNENIYGIKYEVDIEDLKTSTRQAGQQIRQANAEFNEASSRLDDWTKSVDGVSAKLKQLNTILDAEKSKLANLKNSYNEKIDTINRYEQQIEELKAAKQAAIQQYGTESAEVDELNKKIRLLEREQTAATIAADKLKTSITNQQATVNRTERSIGNYEQQLNELEEAQARAERSGNSLEDELKQMRKAANDTGDEVEKMGDGFTVAKGAIANFIADGIRSMISGISNAIEETRELRGELGKLEATAQTMGASFEGAKKNLREVSTITNDTEAGVEGLNNLLSAGFDGKQLDAITDQLLGASIKWKDTLKFEGLADGLQETLATGAAIGPFAEMLERAGLKLDDFDAGLQKAIESGTQQQYVLDTLAKLGLTDVKNAYEENNKTLIESAEAQFDYNEKLAQLAEKAEPILTAIRKGFTKMLDGITDAVDDVDLSGLTDAINTVFDIIGKGTGFVIKNLDKIIPVVGGLVAAWATYKTTVAAATVAEKTANAVKTITATLTKAATTATVANTVATEGATVATRALSLAQKATPWGLVAGLVAGAAAAIGIFISKTKESTEEANKNTVATKEIASSYKELNEELQNNKQAREENLASAGAEVQSASILTDSLEKLAGVENKSNAQKEQMRLYVEKLNELVPELNLQYDAEKDALNKSTDAIREQIDAQKDLVIAKAAQEQLSEIAADMVSTEMELSEATKQHAENQKALTEATEKATQAREDYAKGLTTYGDYKEAIDAEKEAQKNYDKTADTVKNLKNDLEDLDQEYADTDAYAQAKLNSADMKENLNELVADAKAAGVEVPKAVSEGILNGKFQIPASVDEMKSLITYNDLTVKANEAGIKIPKSISEGIKSGELQPSAAVTQMQNLISFNDLLAKSDAAGVAVPSHIQTQILNGSMQPAAAVQYMKDLVTYEDMLQKASDAGVKVPENIKSGVESGKTKPSDAVSQINSLMISKANSTTGQMYSAGSKNASSMASGLSGGASGVKTAATAAAQQGVKGAESKNSDFRDAGEEMARGIEKGTRDRDSSIFSTLSDLAGSMVGWFEKKLGIKSPSKVFTDLSRYIPEGIAAGVSKYAPYARNAVQKLADDVVKSYNAEMDKQPLNGLTDVINSKLSVAKSKLRVAVDEMKISTAGAGNGAGGVVNNITINQTNNSPKALDSLEIYRNTQKAARQLRQLTVKGGL